MAMGMTTLDRRLKRLEKRVKRARRKGTLLPPTSPEQLRVVMAMLVEAGAPLPGGVDELIGRMKSPETTSETHDLDQRRAS